MPEVVENMTTALAAPPETKLTLAGFIPQVGQLAQSGGGDVLRLTVPLKPFRLFTEIVLDVEDPAVTVCGFWFEADRVKLGVTGPASDPF